MLPSRVSRIPSLPTDPAADQPYAARLDALTACPRRLGPGLLSAALGLVGGILMALLWTATTPSATALTPQQQTLYALVQDLAQTTTPDEAWRIMTHLDQVVRTMHPQPRPGREVLLPMQARP